MADQFNLSDVFISYSRKDSDFVRRLDDRLKAGGREVWVDWEDIPPTAEWWAEIKAGIEAANTFIFIISPDSVSSKICHQEIEHALANHKRFVPVLYRPIPNPPPETMHPAVSSHNWVNFSAADDFDAAFTRLMRTLETDLAHTRLHTRLLVNAREWETRGKTADYLLNRAELDEARAWLAAAPGKEPLPTDLHLQYLQASEVEQNRLLAEESARQARELALQRRSARRLGYLAVVLAVFGIVAVGLLAAVVNAQAQLEASRADTFFSQGQIYQEQRSFGEAVAEYTRAIEVRPDFVQAIFERGHSSFQLNDLPAAQADAETAITLQPDFHAAYNLLGAIQIARREFDPALENFARALDLNPEAFEVYTNRAGAYAAQAQEAIGEGRGDLPPDALEKFDLALADYTRSIELNPEFIQSYLGRGYVYMALGQFNEAVSDFTQVIDLTETGASSPSEPDQPPSQERVDALAGRGNAYAALGDIEAAVADYQASNENTLVDTFTPNFFRRLPVDLADTEWVHYYGNTPVAYRVGAQLGYDRNSQGLHSGFDFGNSSRADVPVYAGVEGTVERIFDRPPATGFYIRVGEYQVIYFNLTNLARLRPNQQVTPDTLLGYIDPAVGTQHVHIEIRHVEGLIANPLSFMTKEQLFSILGKFPPSGAYFYRDPLWRRWQTPLDQPIIQVGGPVIGPRAAAYGPG